MRSIYTVAIAAGLLATLPALAVPKAATPIDPQVAQLMKELHQVVALLNAADHDYDGHRAKAVHEVHQAMHALHPNHHHPKSATAATTIAKPVVKTAPNKENQQVSDAQLNKAIQQLQSIRTQLASSSAANQQKAVTGVQAAIGELKTALSIR